MKYLHIFTSLRQGKQASESTQQLDEAMQTQIQEEICNFFGEINSLMQDVYISLFKALFKRVYETDQSKLTEECTKYVLQLFQKDKKEDPALVNPYVKKVIVPEVEEALKYKDLLTMYQEYADANKITEEAGLTKLLIKQLVGASDIKLETSLLKAMVGYHLQKTELVEHLDDLFIIADDKCAKKYHTLFELMPQMADCLNQLASWLNVSDVKTLKQSSFYLGLWKSKLMKLMSLFSEDEFEPTEGIKKTDQRFVNLFTKSRTYSLIINFLKLTAKVKLEAANNVIHGSDNLGLHAVTFSRELLKVIELSNQILSVYCRDSSISKEYFYRIS